MKITTALPNTTTSSLLNLTVAYPRGDKPYPLIVKKIGFSVLPVIIFFSILGNSLVIHLTRKHAILKGVMKVFITNLAICNIVLCLFPCLYLVELGTNEWHFKSIGCDILVVFEYAALTSANLSLVLIAVERLCAIVNPFKKEIGKKGTRCMLTISWLVGFPLAVPFVILQPRYVDDDHPNALAQPECNNMWAVTTIGMPTSSLIYYSVMFVLLYVVPGALICIVYTKIMYFLLRKLKRPGYQTTESKKRDHERNLRTIKLLWSSVILFKLLWLPSYVQEFLLAGGVLDLKANVRIQVINLICAALGYAYCAVTPWMYFIFNSQYKVALKNLLCKTSFNIKSHLPTTKKYTMASFVNVKSKKRGENNGIVELGNSTPMVEIRNNKGLLNDAFEKNDENR